MIHVNVYNIMLFPFPDQLVSDYVPMEKFAKAPLYTKLVMHCVCIYIYQLYDIMVAVLFTGNGTKKKGIQRKFGYYLFVSCSKVHMYCLLRQHGDCI